MKTAGPSKVIDPKYDLKHQLIKLMACEHRSWEGKSLKALNNTSPCPQNVRHLHAIDVINLVQKSQHEDCI